MTIQLALPLKGQRQADLIARRLLAGSPVNPVTAGAEGVWRLSSIIHRLRRRGWPIVTERAHNNGMARYSIPHGWAPPLRQQSSSLDQVAEPHSTFLRDYP